MKSNKKGASNTALVILGLAVVVVLAVVFLGGKEATTPDQPSIKVITSGVALSLSAVDANALSTVLTDSNDVRIKSAGASVAGLTTGDNSITVSQGDWVEIFYQANSTTYYPVKEVIASVAETTTLDKQGRDWKIGSLESRIFNADDNVANSADARNALGTGENLNQQVTVVLSSDGQSFGDPSLAGSMTNVIACQGNKTAFQGISIDGLKATKVPTSFDITTGNAGYAFEAPIFALSAAGNPVPANTVSEKTFTIRTDTEDATDMGNSTIVCNIFDVANFRNADNQEIESGVEDEDNNNVGGTNFAFSIYTG